MQDRNEEIFSLDADMYLTEIDKLEKSGLKFKEILNDVIEFEKGVILNEFQLINEEGETLFGLKESIIRAIGSCVLCGIIWYQEENRTMGDFLEGFFLPFVCILIFSVLGLPVYFIGKKNPQLAQKIKKIGTIIAVSITIGLLIIAIIVNI